MTYHIIWKNSDDTLVIDSMNPVMSIEEVIVFKDKKVIQGLQFCKIIESSDLPQERYFRPAWRWNGTAITMNLPACRQRHIDKLRRIRDFKLQISDAEYMKAMEQNDITRLNVLKQYRQALRDMPNTLQNELLAAPTAERIKAILPAIFDQQI